MRGTRREHREPGPAGPASAMHSPGGPVFWCCLAVGAGLIAYGLGGAWVDRAETLLLNLGAWLAGAGIVHDIVLAPLVVILAWLSGRLPASARTPVRLGLALSALLTVLFWPTVKGWGRSSSVPSALPLDYGRNLLAVLAAIWVIVGVTVLVRLLRRQR